MRCSGDASFFPCADGSTELLGSNSDGVWSRRIDTTSMLALGHMVSLSAALERRKQTVFGPGE